MHKRSQFIRRTTKNHRVATFESHDTLACRSALDQVFINGFLRPNIGPLMSSEAD